MTTNEKSRATALSRAPSKERTRPGDDLPAIEAGQWVWVKDHGLGCVSHLGSNYVEVTLAGEKWRSTLRVPLKEYDDECSPAPDAEEYLQRQIDKQQNRVRSLLEGVRRLTTALGVRPHGALAPQEAATQALTTAHQVADPVEHKEALIKAKDKQLPELFKQMREAQEQATHYMKTQLLPLEVEAKQLKGLQGSLESRILTVELKSGKKAYRAAMKEWKAKGSPREGKPWRGGFYSDYDGDDLDKYRKVEPEWVYYDDVMKCIADDMEAHNRIAVVIQGLLDRSPVFHPHPPWRLWDAEEFGRALELVYDDSRVLVAGDPPDFEAFRSSLNAQLKRGDYTVGQQDAWIRHEAKKANERNDRSWNRDRTEYERYKPYGNPGPGEVAQVTRLTRTGKASFRWERERVGWNTKWVPDPERPGYEVVDRSPIAATFTCSTDVLLNVSAYQAGDYKQFFEDPRTRQDYLKWAPILLEAEDFVHGKKQED